MSVTFKLTMVPWVACYMRSGNVVVNDDVHCILLFKKLNIEFFTHILGLWEKCVNTKDIFIIILLLSALSHNLIVYIGFEVFKKCYWKTKIKNKWKIRKKLFPLNLYISYYLLFFLKL